MALCEEATVRALDGQLETGETSVGMRVQLDHLQPTSVGNRVRAEAHLEKVEGRRLTFTVSAHDERGLIAAGKVTRVVVDRDRFLEKLGWTSHERGRGHRRAQDRPSTHADNLCSGRSPRAHRG